MDLTDLLNEASIDPANTLVLRHRPRSPQLRRVLPWLAAEQAEVFNAYQQTQYKRVQGQMERASHIVALIGDEPGRAVFVGIYENQGSRMTDLRARQAIPAHRELTKYGHPDEEGECLWFHLVLTEYFSEWSGKLILKWPPPEVAWSRWCSRNEFSIEAILEESLLTHVIPSWHELVLTWNELQAVPRSLKDRLSQWRGVYFILDTTDGRGYVGSAYGKENIHGRWQNYAKTGHGGNKRLRTRESENLRFSILQRVSPDTEPSEVIELEATWKKRLHTRDHGLNDN